MRSKSTTAAALLVAALVISLSAIVFGILGISGVLDTSLSTMSIKEPTHDMPVSAANKAVGKSAAINLSRKPKQELSAAAAKLNWGSPKQDRKLFVLVSQQRSGSKWTMSNIMRFPSIWMKFMEPLSAKSQVSIWGNSSVSGAVVSSSSSSNETKNMIVSLDDYLRRFDESVAYVETLYRGSGGNSSVATHCGFKVMISQLPDDLPDLKRWIRHIRRHYDAKVLFLVRENHLERHISGRMSMATGFSHLDTGKDGDKANLTEQAKQTQEMVIKLGPGRAVSYIEAAEAEVARMRKALQQVQARDPQFQYLELNYETLLQDPTKFSPVAKFLDGNAATSQQTNVSSSLENSQPRSETLRLHPKTCAEKVSNWADLVRVLRKNGKEKYIQMCEGNGKL